MCDERRRSRTACLRKEVFQIASHSVAITGSRFEGEDMMQQSACLEISRWRKGIEGDQRSHVERAVRGNREDGDASREAMTTAKRRLRY